MYGERAPMKDTIICDIDGTLADCTHRRHFVEMNPPDWDAFCREELVLRDRCIEPTRLILGLFHREGYRIVLCSGRRNKYRDVTSKWLVFNDVRFDALMMRGDDEFIPDEQLKEIWLHRYGVERVAFVIDDRKKVVEMWRRNGLLCFDVAGYEG